MPLEVGCDRPCAVGWDLTIDAKLRKRLRLRSARLDRRVILTDEDGFMRHVAARQHFVADVLGSAAEKALKRVKSFKATLEIEVHGRDGLSITQTKSLKIG
jgi:CRP-like cAMP-binding protein